MDVFDERDGEQIGVGDVANDDRHFEQARALCGPPAAFTGDDLVAALDQSHEDRLNHAMTADRLRELFEPRLVDLLPRLARIRAQSIEVDFSGLRSRLDEFAGAAPRWQESVRSSRDPVPDVVRPW